MRGPISLHALVAPPGSTVVVRFQSLAPEQRESLRNHIADLNKTGAVRFVVFEGEWEACVIGAPE